jgi:hypothetical protein
MDPQLQAAAVALEISSRNARVAALQKRWERLRAGLDRFDGCADMTDLPGGATELLVTTVARKPPFPDAVKT